MQSFRVMQKILDRYFELLTENHLIIFYFFLISNNFAY